MSDDLFKTREGYLEARVEQLERENSELENEVEYWHKLWKRAVQSEPLVLTQPDAKLFVDTVTETQNDGISAYELNQLQVSRSMWKADAEIFKERLTAAEAVIEELQQERRDQAKGHQEDGRCWQIERTKLIEENSQVRQRGNYSNPQLDGTANRMSTETIFTNISENTQSVSGIGRDGSAVNPNCLEGATGAIPGNGLQPSADARAATVASSTAQDWQQTACENIQAALDVANSWGEPDGGSVLTDKTPANSMKSEQNQESVTDKTIAQDGDK